MSIDSDSTSHGGERLRDRTRHSPDESRLTKGLPVSFGHKQSRRPELHLFHQPHDEGSEAAQGELKDVSDMEGKRQKEIIIHM